MSRWEELSEVERVQAEEAAAEARAIAAAEQRIAELIALGATDREAAIRWMHQSHDTDGDAEYLCFKLGVPYGYFNAKETA